MRLTWFDRANRVVRDDLRKAPKNCPRCGRRMVTRTIYYECQGCGHTENLPRTRPNRDTQPVDNLAAGRQQKDLAADAWDSEFALVVVPPTMATEFRWLCRIGAILVLFVIGFWGLMLWTGVVADLDEQFVMCWQVSLLGAIILALALLHSARFLKQLGIVVTLAMIPVLIYAHTLISNALNVGSRNKPPDLMELFGHALAVHSYIAAVVYCAWLAWYLIRERRLQGR